MSILCSCMSYQVVSHTLYYYDASIWMFFSLRIWICSQWFEANRIIIATPPCQFDCSSTRAYSTALFASLARTRRLEWEKLWRMAYNVAHFICVTVSAANRKSVFYNPTAFDCCVWRGGGHPPDVTWLNKAEELCRSHVQQTTNVSTKCYWR